MKLQPTNVTTFRETEGYNSGIIFIKEKVDKIVLQDKNKTTISFLLQHPIKVYYTADNDDSIIDIVIGCDIKNNTLSLKELSDAFKRISKKRLLKKRKKWLEK